MTALEDHLRKVMRAHDSEAPDVTEFSATHSVPAAVSVQRPRGARWRIHDRWMWPAAAGALGAAILVFALLIVRHVSEPRPATGPLSCPVQVQETNLNGSLRASGDPDWVPAPPDGLDGRDRLTSAATPAHVVICAYLQGRALTGSRQLTGAVGAVTATTYWEPPGPTQPGCEQVRLLTDSDTYLIGLTFAGATEWVAAPRDHCSGSSNGRFTSNANLGTYAAAAYRTGSWPSRDPGALDNPCSSSGRYGQQDSIVPDSPTGLEICANGRLAKRFSPSQFTDLLAQLRALKTVHDDTGGCKPITGFSGRRYLLSFEYPQGPPISVSVWAGCRPGVLNGDLTAEDAGPISNRIQRMLGTH